MTKNFIFLLPDSNGYRDACAVQLEHKDTDKLDYYTVRHTLERLVRSWENSTGVDADCMEHHVLNGFRAAGYKVSDLLTDFTTIDP